MRICYLADGRCKHVHRWMQYFSALGHDMSFISYQPVWPEHIAEIQRAGGTYHGEVGPFHLKRFWRTARDLSWLRRYLKRERIDVLHCHFVGPNTWYSALSRFHPLVITVMGGDVCGPDWRPGKDVRERYLTPLAFRQANLVTCWSHQLTEVTKRYTSAGTPIEVVHGGVDLERFAPGPKPDHLYERWDLPPVAKVILSPRLMRPLYNLDMIARAAVRVCNEDPAAYFLFAYLPEAKDDAYEAQVRAIVRDGGIEDRVRFIEAIPYDQMADYYRLADVTVSVPSTDGTPLTVLESMACGTPLVVSELPDYDRQYVEPDETVLAASVGDFEKLAAQLLCLLNEPELARRLSIEARRRVVASGSVEAQMSHMEQLYQQLLLEKAQE